MGNTDKLKADFPQLSRKVNGKQLHYLDSAATALVPQPVIDAIKEYYTNNASAYGGIHELSGESTRAVDETRNRVRKFINAARDSEIVFTKGTTEGINLLASTLCDTKLNKGGHIVVTQMEHHANFVPWQQIAKEKQARFTVSPVLPDGTLDIKKLNEILDSGDVTILAITHVSNTLGTINPIKQIIRRAHKNGTLVVVDGAQAVPHIKVDVQSLDADFYVFSGHKLYGPTGIGVVYGKREHWLDLPPYQTGGKMIASVSEEETEFAKPPQRFEAGTPNVAGIVGLGSAIQYVEKILKKTGKHEQELLEYTTTKLSEMEGLKIIGNAKEKIGIVSFTIEGLHPHDIGTVADQYGVALRTGHLCTEPLLKVLNVSAVTRVSLSVFNTRSDIDALVEAIHQAKKILR